MGKGTRGEENERKWVWSRLKNLVRDGEGRLPGANALYKQAELAAKHGLVDSRQEARLIDLILRKRKRAFERMDPRDRTRIARFHNRVKEGPEEEPETPGAAPTALVPLPEAVSPSSPGFEAAREMAVRLGVPAPGEEGGMVQWFQGLEEALLRQREQAHHEMRHVLGHLEMRTGELRNAEAHLAASAARIRELEAAAMALKEALDHHAALVQQGEAARQSDLARAAQAVAEAEARHQELAGQLHGQLHARDVEIINAGLQHTHIQEEAHKQIVAVTAAHEQERQRLVEAMQLQKEELEGRLREAALHQARMGQQIFELQSSKAALEQAAREHANLLLMGEQARDELLLQKTQELEAAEKRYEAQRAELLREHRGRLEQAQGVARDAYGRAAQAEARAREAERRAAAAEALVPPETARTDAAVGPDEDEAAMSEASAEDAQPILPGAEDLDAEELDEVTALIDGAPPAPESPAGGVQTKPLPSWDIPQAVMDGRATQRPPLRSSYVGGYSSWYL